MAEDKPARLADRVADLIRRDGPLRLDQYMDLALHDATHGYYATRDPLGAGGDFITAPEISQVFGELIGLWCAVTWQMLGCPTPLRLVELGPGRGTLMGDLLRAAGAVPGFRDAVSIHLVETSPVLRARQRALLGDKPVWHAGLDQVPDGPMLLVANEFFDALPIRQFEKSAGIWRERRVGLDPAGGFAFVAGEEAPAGLIAPAVAGAGDGAIAEICEAGRALAAAIGRRIAADGGAALIVDYGAERSRDGESLQAVKAHAYHPALDDPGAADLTAHVDFPALAGAAPGVSAHGPVPQGMFLLRLGAAERIATLAQASPDQAEQIRKAANRLIDPRQMGTLFKVLCLAPRSLPTPPGFAP
jgi:NADH dehydrogenase [ubiquinone] 1 alpha subcomplex assembly factor 7